jgi:hypothetical protein
MAEPSYPKTPDSDLVRGRFVDLFADNYVQAALVTTVTGGENSTVVVTADGRETVTPYDVERVLYLLNLSLMQPTLNAAGPTGNQSADRRVP